ncbi:MAG: hypothetical protein Unbinned1520contig1002_38 [Prokaryotic dsDNA virus sp.]|nr:MAG: hypothetical protein Unbinned1520contig1002_38 [Prokaryotic dsDNA virus sp.]
MKANINVTTATLKAITFLSTYVSLGDNHNLTFIKVGFIYREASRLAVAVLVAAVVAGIHLDY